MNTEKETKKDKARKILLENEEGLEILAQEQPAEEQRKHPVKTKLKRLYRKYIGKPRAEPKVI